MIGVTQVKNTKYGHLYTVDGFCFPIHKVEPPACTDPLPREIVSTRHQHVWDGTTWVFRKALGRYIKDGIGCWNSVQVISEYWRFIAAIRKIEMIAVDINE